MATKTFNKGQKKRRTKRAKGVNNRQNQRIAKLENLLLPTIEYKSRDIVTSGAIVNSAGYTNFPMFQLAQGEGVSERIGDKVTLMSHQVSLSLVKGDANNIIRVIFAVTPSDDHLSLSDVLEYSSYTTHSELVFSSPYKQRASNTAKSYKILFDKVYNLTDDINTLVDKFRLMLPKKGKQVNFSGVASQQPDNYNLSMLAISDSTSVVHPQLHAIVRSKYIDL